MKTKILIFVSAFALFFSACSDDDNDSDRLESHDRNEMMDVFHAMMERMDTVRLTNDPEIDFASMMIQHHQGIIDMSNLELQEGENDSLQRTAQKYINAQQREIAELRTYLQTQSVNNSVPAFTTEQMANMMKMDKSVDVQFITGDTDNDFATITIPHHQGAIENAQTYLKYGNDNELKMMAMEMMEAQTMEIEELHNWLIANKRN
jgi:uncharacterized protein (DUF305 family)